jgi:hypothetical protein
MWKMSLFPFLLTLAAGAAPSGPVDRRPVSRLVSAPFSADAVSFRDVAGPRLGAPNAIEPLAARGLLPALVAVFLPVLPPLAYSCLAGAWIPGFIQRALTQ